MPIEKPWPTEAIRLLLADACVPGRHEHSYWNFVRLAAGWHFRCKEPRQLDWITDRLHKPFCDWIQHHIEEWRSDRERGVNRRRKVLIWVFRTFGKTNLISKCVPVYVMLDEPNMTSYIGSETHPKAQELLAPIQAMISGGDQYALFAWLYGNWYSAERTWTRTSVVTAYRTSLGVTEPSIGTFGVETGLTGKHPLLVNYDDPISEEKIKDGGNTLESAITSFDSIHFALRPDSIFFFEGTRYRDNDVIGTILRKEGVASWTGHQLAEKFPFQEDGWHVFFLAARDQSNTVNFDKGEPMLPEVHDDFQLQSKERTDPNYFAQMMGNPRLDTKMELTREQCAQLIMQRKDLPPIEYATVHLDTAFKEDSRRAKGDRNAIVGWLHDIRPNGMVYLDKIHCSSTWRSEEFDTHLVSYLLDLKRRGYRVRAITDEKEMGGKRGVYARHLQNVLQNSGIRPPEFLQFNRAGTKKVIRIREAANYWLEGYVRLVSDCPNLDLLIEEMTGIGLSRFDDISDAAADVFRPEVWRGSHQLEVDPQPGLPTQPGDEILKGRWYKEVGDIEYELRHGKSREDELDDFQPYDALMQQESRT